MSRIPGRFVVLVSLMLVAGCMTPGRVNLTSIKSNGVDHIPAKIAIYPFLSTTLTTRDYGYSAVRTMSLSSLSINRSGDNVAVTPPSDTEMLVTRESQMMTDALTPQLSTYGFVLKQLPVEMHGADDKDSKKQKGFYISMSLLNDLRTNYGIEAIALCDAFFTNAYRYGGPSEVRVVSANVKIIDTKTLDVLGQVNLPYAPDGADLNATVTEMASSLAWLANLTAKDKKQEKP